ncbi:uncharacterized protein LOC131687766 [Topomyia yanbarensis]|uniref:uncharacterized protein LOC131687766 n=1 Tax=Topomyia yanbarensis TaxID=2498891 RepID=UPI00273A9AD6|nr:uncharacterized protein LOC131687766 [Topomyia yanbarensis]
MASRCGKFQTTIEMMVVPKVLEDQPNAQMKPESIKVLTGLTLADPTLYKKRGVEILLGARIFFQILGPRCTKLATGPTFQESALGWLVGGLVSTHIKPKATLAVVSVKVENHDERDDEHHDELDCLFKQFWNHDAVSATNSSSNECEDHFSKNTTVGSDGKFIVRIPMNGEPELLGLSYQQARRRLLSLERRLIMNPDLYEEYREFLREYLELGHMKLISPNDLAKVQYFIPHSCVIKAESTSTKLRVVFDASAKTSINRSLNDLQRCGPVIQRDLFDLLLDFRCHDKVVTADIAKMDRQINVHDDDTWMQFILWRAQTNEEIHAYRLTTVTYGEAASSFLACRALYQTTS